MNFFSLSRQLFINLNSFFFAIIALEEVLGEYVLNIDKENLKIAALRGKIKLENVQLDGDLLGSHILGAVGLSGFGILSCFAKSVKITIPLKNLEKEPTRIEMRGVHLLCLPLLPSTAPKMYGAGTVIDPRCTLRTRAKRAKLSRFEGNYMTGRLPGEGPPARRVLRAVKDVERDLQKKRQLKKGSKQDGAEDDSTVTFDSFAPDLSEVDSLNSTTEPMSDEGTEEKSLKDDPASLSGSLPDLPRDWKVKLREKVMRNMESSMHDVHVRCEVSECGLDFLLPDRKSNASVKADQRAFAADQRAFAFGATLDKFVFRTANEKWEAGSHEKTTETSEKNHLGPNEYDAKNNKLMSFENFCMYWDDEPAFLLSESEIMTSPDHKLSEEKIQSRIATAMEAMYLQQEPGRKIRESMQISKQKNANGDSIPDRPHQYIYKGFNCTVRQKLSNRMEPGPISSLFEFMPFHWDVTYRPHQYLQYQKLKSAMLSQQRFDTMLRQRPAQNPIDNPRAWWKYAYGCVTTRPNSRPWHDVVRIARARSRYVQLVMKKMSRSSEGSGFHAGLSASESAELLALEDLLPIEALFAFHLIALRKFSRGEDYGEDEGASAKVDSPNPSKVVGRRSLARIFRGSKAKSSSHEVNKSVPAPKPPIRSHNTGITSLATSTTSTGPMSLLEAMTIRMGKKMWFINWKIHHAKLHVTLLSTADVPIVKLEAETSGTARSFGPGKRDFYFDVTKFEVVDTGSKKSGENPGEDGKILVVQAAEDEKQKDHVGTIKDILGSLSGFDPDTLLGFMELPPPGVVCRLSAAKDITSMKLSFSAHPATLVWTRPCFDALAQFFGAPSTEMQTELTRHLKSAATPLARKAQLALLSPKIVLLHVNVAAPKIWVPVSQKGADGAVLLDAGKIRMSCTKGDNQSDMNWNVDATNIQVNFVRWRFSEMKERIMSSAPFAVVESPNEGVTSIIRPFQVRVVSGVRDWHSATDADSSSNYRGAISCIDVSISPICLNLVDAEVLARAIGKWYAQGLVRVRGRVSSRSRNNKSQSTETTMSEPETGDFESSRQIHNSMPQTLSVRIEKIELALEGHSKAGFSDDRSIASHETSLFGDYAPPTRTYVVEVFQISVRRSKHGDTTATKLVVSDASIVQLMNADDYIPMKTRHEASESHYQILERGTMHEPEDNVSSPRRRRDGLTETSESRPCAEILTASLFHDGTVHLDEVELDLDSVILRVTPTTLKDCAKGIRQIVELMQLMTREMERKVHEEGRKSRKARLRERDGRSYWNSGGLLTICARTLTHLTPIVKSYLRSSRCRRASKGCCSSSLPCIFGHFGSYRFTEAR
jgi:hypothetical protein